MFQGEETLDAFVNRKGKKHTSRVFGLSPNAIRKALRSDRMIFVVTNAETGAVSGYELKPFGSPLLTHLQV